jgi:hypothetical protein
MSSNIELAVADVVDYLKITGRFAPALRAVVERKITIKTAKKAGVKVSVKDIQRAADVFRVAHDLAKASDMKKWLGANGLSQDAFEDYIETNLVISKFKDTLLRKTKISKYLASQAIGASVREMVYHDWLDAALKA